MIYPQVSAKWVKSRPLDENGRVEVVDCTLRDGEQAPGVWLTVEQKVELAARLSAMGVDVLDAGFPASGTDEIEALRQMRARGLRAKIGATSRLVARDIDAAVEAQADGVFLFAPVSDLQLQRTLNLNRVGLRERFVESTQYAISKGLEVSIVFGDVTQADPNYVLHLTRMAEAMPIERLVLCDSMGTATPDQMSNHVRLIRSVAPSIVLAVHCHNDFGMATANTVAALQAGANSFTATVNGIGERAGNADLAEVLAALSHLLKRQHGVNPKELPNIARDVERLTGIHTSPLKPVTGMNVYRHESGIHVDAILKEPSSYHALPPDWTDACMELVLGKHSGAAQIRALLDSAGLPSDERTVGSALTVLKSCREICDRSDLSEMYDIMEGFRRRVLGGVSVERLLELVHLQLNCEREAV
ncbi:MAG: hypothetical protein QM784_38310 [Polyangiaceae bacterium]